MRPKRLFGNGKKQRGNALVELSLALPLLIALFLGTWQFGYAYYLYGELEQSVRAGGRYASLAAYDAADPSGFETAVRNVVVYGDPDPAAGARPVVPGLSPAHVQVEIIFSGAMPTAVTVSISGYELPGMFTSIVLDGKPSNQFPYLGPWAPV
ncbi:MAG TPA: TadE/TadG family type IV pilus assembly protein [Bryobacteraceae bacterium]|nr:TadE/TadG family type IV pilus assembly protein [Bryobacteraceae bacterium]HOL70643.1 TadE/TadG family type IV pilus assembly protein [Bryobacteraceae bacterium]HOQ45959.1 TadE/TadG family type IV pilus assembly protein [Bryobacteraceae bacterium]HPU73222.1 TadE/TadG family type IV pilus assembly protein [Bryobacteraceae bacterium]